MRSILVLTLIATVIACVVVENLPEGDARADAMIERRSEIESISINGSALPLAQLRGVMSTHLGGTVDRATLAQDRLALQRNLAARGYLAASVSDPVVTFGPTGGVYVVFDIERGPLFHLGEVTLDGAGWRDAGVVTLATGDEALAERLERARQAAQDTLIRHGKQLRVDLELVPDPTQPLVDVRLVTR